jgi:hypothetical protein
VLEELPMTYTFTASIKKVRLYAFEGAQPNLGYTVDFGLSPRRK